MNERMKNPKQDGNSPAGIIDAICRSKRLREELKSAIEKEKTRLDKEAENLNESALLVCYKMMQMTELELTGKFPKLRHGPSESECYERLKKFLTFCAYGQIYGFKELEKNKNKMLQRISNLMGHAGKFSRFTSGSMLDAAFKTKTEGKFTFTYGIYGAHEWDFVIQEKASADIKIQKADDGRIQIKLGKFDVWRR